MSSYTMLGDTWDKVKRRAAASFSQMNCNCVRCCKPILSMATMTDSRPEHSVPTRMVLQVLASLTVNHAEANGVRWGLLARLLAIFFDCRTIFTAVLRRLLRTKSFAWAALGAEPCPCPRAGCFLLHPRFFAHAAEPDEVPRCSRRTWLRSTSSSQSKSIAWELNKCCHDRQLQRPLEFSNNMHIARTDMHLYVRNKREHLGNEVQHIK